ncbi:MAG TPA: NAD(P)H-binding protein [Solirubrobacteraceae bacterium]|nr:NAD(P)H-binding protein [Solirubrobacteraceae bacterium]
MLLLTGATGTVGAALLRRLTATGRPVRCLVREPRRLGAERVRVQIALGDLADPPSFRNALRGVDTVVHLAASIRDQRAGSIEELNGIATWRMVRAAEHAGVGHFVFASALGASTSDRTRFMRAKALAERAVLASTLRHAVVAPSVVYAPGDRYLTLLARLALLPAVPAPGRGRVSAQPIWADDVADCLMALLDGRGDGRVRHELAGPDTLSHRAIVEIALRAAGRPRPVVRVPGRAARRLLRASEWVLGSRAPVTWDEAELLEVPMTTARGTADAQALGVTPRSMAAVLGATDPERADHPASAGRRAAHG